MKILNAVIIEDEELSMTILKSILKDLSYIKVVAAVDNMEDGEKEILFHKPQLLFLDIRIHGEPVFNLLKELESRNIDFGIVFTTAYHDEYLKAAIENCGTKYKFVYLGKPINSTTLITRVNILRKEMMKNTKEEEDPDSELVIHHQSGLTRLLCDEIFYCEVEGNESVIHTTDEKVEVVNSIVRGDFNEVQ